MTTGEQSGTNGETVEARLAVLEALFVQLAQCGATECILEHGFKRVSRRLKDVSDGIKGLGEQLAPLKNLDIGQSPFKDEKDLLMGRLYAALTPPKTLPPPKELLPDEGEPSVHMRSAS